MTNIVVRRDSQTLEASKTQNSTLITTPLAMTSDNNHENMKRWTKNPEARIFCINTLSALYALILTMIAFVIEISPTWRSQEMWLEYSIFGVLMYLFAILYFTYFYLFVIYPNIINSIIYFLHRRGRIASLHRWLLEEPVFNGEGAGTMYLRIGTLFFGSMGAVLYITEILLCFFDTQRNGIYVTKYTLAVAFIYMQMHFIFSNSKVLLKSSNAIAKFGLMHSVAVNLWTWLSICLIKSDMKHSKKEMKHAEDGLKNQTATNVLAQWSYNLTTNSFGAHDKQLRTIVKMGSSANLLLTCLVEFSLIAAVICFIIWKNDHPNPGNSEKKPKKQSVRFDCNGTSVGLFTAIFIHIISVVVIGLHGIYMKDHNEKVADQLIGYTDVLMFVILLFACLLALFQMRKLQYTSHVHGEVIDDILLIVGLAGECVYSCAAIDLYVNEKLMDRPVPYITMIAFSLRITEVIVQTLFILIAARMRSSPLSNKQPGKQVITFLLICNINLFIYHTFETTESSFGFPAKVSEVYTVMLTIASPIVVFYRFHSSACLAEIWKNTYLRNGHDANVGPADSNEKLMMIDKL